MPYFERAVVGVAGWHVGVVERIVGYVWGGVGAAFGARAWWGRKVLWGAVEDGEVGLAGVEEVGDLGGVYGLGGWGEGGGGGRMGVAAVVDGRHRGGG